jgi:Tfp pilus assembly protein PilF
MKVSRQVFRCLSLVPTRLFQGPPQRLGLRWGLLLASGVLLYYLAFLPLHADYHCRQAQAALENHDCAQAQLHLEKCLRGWGNKAKSHFELARCCWREGEPDEAERHLREAERLGWPSKDIEVEELLILAQHELTRSLEVTLGDLVQHAKDQEDHVLETMVLEASALAFLRAERHDASGRLAKRLLEMHPENWRYHTLFGRSLQDHETDAAARVFVKAVTLHDAQPKVHRWLAVYFARSARPREALDHLRAAQPIAADDVEAEIAEAKARLLLGQFALSRNLLERAWTKGADQLAWAWTVRGRLELDEHGPAEAAAWLARAEALTPYHPETLDALIALAARQGNVANVQRYQQRKQDRDKAVREFQSLRKTLDSLGRDPNAKSEERQAAAYRAGQIMFRTGHDEKGIAWMQNVLNENPDHVQANQALAEYYDRVGLTEKADLHRRKIAMQQDGR